MCCIYLTWGSKHQCKRQHKSWLNKCDQNTCHLNVLLNENCWLDSLAAGPGLAQSNVNQHFAGQIILCPANFGHTGKMSAGSIFQFNTPAAAVKMWLNGNILNKNNFRNISAGWQNCWPLTWISVSNYLLIPWCRGTVNHQHPPSTQSLNKLPWASKFEAEYLKFSRFSFPTGWLCWKSRKRIMVLA